MPTLAFESAVPLRLRQPHVADRSGRDCQGARKSLNSPMPIQWATHRKVERMEELGDGHLEDARDRCHRPRARDVPGWRPRAQCLGQPSRAPEPSVARSRLTELLMTDMSRYLPLGLRQSSYDCPEGTHQVERLQCPHQRFWHRIPAEYDPRSAGGPLLGVTARERKCLPVPSAWQGRTRSPELCQGVLPVQSMRYCRKNRSITGPCSRRLGPPRRYAPLRPARS